MANVVTIEAEARARAGKGAARATRRAGKVPAVVYGAHKAPSLIALEPRAVLRELHRPGWQSRLYEIKVNGDATRALIRDVQFHPVSDAPEHVDFQRLAPGEPIRVAVPVHFENEGLSPGLKRGGVLNVIRHAVEVYCDPGPDPGTVQRQPGGSRLQRQRALARPEGHRKRPPGDHRSRLRRRHGGAAHQGAGGCGGARCGGGGTGAAAAAAPVAAAAAPAAGGRAAPAAGGRAAAGGGRGGTRAPGKKG